MKIQVKHINRECLEQEVMGSGINIALHDYNCRLQRNWFYGNTFVARLYCTSKLIGDEHE